MMSSRSRLPHGPVAFRAGQQGHGRVFSRAVSGARRRRRRRPAARRRRSKWSASSPCERAPTKPVTALRGVGDALAARLRALGVETTQDLLFLLPLRYEDRTRVVPLGELEPGQRAAVEGEVLLTEIAFRGRRQMLCRIGDGSGFLTLRFFHFTAQQQQGLERGVRVRCFGEARRGPGGLEIVHPEYRRVGRPARERRRGPPDADLPRHRGHHPGTAAPAGRHWRSIRPRRAGAGGLAARRAARRFAAAALARGAAVRAPAAGGRAGGAAARMAPSGAAAARVRGAAGASAVAQAAAPADPARSGLAARRRRLRSRRGCWPRCRSR